MLAESAVRGCLAIPQLESWVLDYSCRHRLEHLTEFCLEGRHIGIPEHGALPLRMISAALWSSVMRRRAEHYDRVLDFVNMIWQQAAGLISYRHYLKLCIAFKAKLVMEMFVKQRSLLDILQTLDRFFPKLVPGHPRATKRDALKERLCVLQFRKLVLLLIRDEESRKLFLQDELEADFGNLFMAAAQRLLWEFLERLESVLPRPRIDQLLATCVDVGCLSAGEQSLVSVLLDFPTSVPDVLLTLMQRMRRERSQELSDPSRGGSETRSGIPRISSSVGSILSRGHCPEAEQVTPDPWLEGQESNAEPTRGNAKHQGERIEETGLGRTVIPPSVTGQGEETVSGNKTSNGQSTGSGTGGGRKLYPLRSTPERQHHGELGSSSVQGQHLVFAALHFDQSGDDQSEDYLVLSPPDPLQSQVNLDSVSPVLAWTRPQTQVTKPQSQPLNPPGLGLKSDHPASNRHPGSASLGQAHSGCPPRSHSLSPNQSPGNGIDLKVLAAAPLSREVQEWLSRSPLFQPKVLLLRLSVDQNGRPIAPEGWKSEREAAGRGGGRCQLGGAANSPRQGSGQIPPTGQWTLRNRPRESRLKAAQAAAEQAVMLLNSSDRSLLFSSEQSSYSDASDYEYFPFCSQVNLSSRDRRRNTIGQFTGSVYADH